MLTPSLLGPIDFLAAEVVAGVILIEFVLLGLIIANLAARIVAHRDLVATAQKEGVEAEDLSRNRLLEASTIALVLGSFYYITVQVHGGVIFGTLVLGLFLTDFFEFESRLVEIRTETPIEWPKGSLVASAFAFAYIAYQSLFFIIEPLWSAVV